MLGKRSPITCKIKKKSRPCGYIKKKIALSSAETKIYPVHKCSNANIYKQDKLQTLTF